MPEKDPFQHLLQDRDEEEPSGSSLHSNTVAKRVTLGIFVVFLLLFPHYAPWEPGYEQSDSWVQRIFTLYFFVANQTLGIVHEAGHGVCYILPCPEFLTMANGTLFQLLFPGLISYYYYRRGKLFAALIALFFVGFSLQYTAWYLSTAHEGRILPAHKSFLGVDAIHDFNYMLSAMGLLAYESLIAGFTRFIAYLIMLAAVIGMFFEAFQNTHKKGVKRGRRREKKTFK
ncbi:hypothetical protein MN086_02295 [Sulfurovum sp. XGS-02]|uniref:hypothetical protein n=1 Tax=Sulfurovum sp. XGS-02 TaxID=2925411 RepID=UPI0020629EF9|nr:hypothetical protein [Sulfurovum sp. XGS-02]UPT77986.1 hypothetical protein MN086_02295 [Sulfurovum sp. XGS-02]